MESDEGWVMLDSDNPADSDDDGGVLALSSSCPTPDASDDDEVVGDDGEGLYDLEDAEEDEQPRPPPPKPLSGLFHHTPSSAASYAPFDALCSAKQLIPDPAFSVFPEEVTVLASTRGLVCLRGRTTGLYYITNPVTFKRVRLPPPNREHRAFGEPAVVITFDESCFDDDIDHYHVVVAFHIGDGIFGFESFSSRTCEWLVGGDICAVESVVSASGVGALGRAFWRTTTGYILCYNPQADYPERIFAPPEVEHRPLWELGEMDGNLCVTCMDERVNEVVVLELNRSAGEIPWAWAGQFDSCKLRNRKGVTLLRSQGGAEVVMFDPQAELVVAMDLEGHTTRTIGTLSGTKYYADFIPYVSSIAEISSEQLGAEC